MEIKRYIFIVIVCLIILPQGNALGINEYGFELDEYLIYSTVVDEWYSNEQNKEILIRDHTSVYQLGRPIETELDYVRQQMPVLEDEIINDFKAKNVRTYSLESFINQRVDYIIISQKEIDYIFDHNPHWDSYYDRYPSSGGILTLSRVGFNRQRTRAILHVANQWNRSTGAGIYLSVVKQKDGSWKIENQQRTWHSWNRDKINP
ncbi:MAG: hypothetical protein K9L86_02390 [Candidatus Omnitrophica bacterium]|nr:hypothetical protein [Candidatus Omnitrophota bacterium]